MHWASPSSPCTGEVIFSYLEPTLPPDLVFAQSDFNPDIDRLTVSKTEWLEGGHSTVPALAWGVSGMSVLRYRPLCACAGAQ